MEEFLRKLGLYWYNISCHADDLPCYGVRRIVTGTFSTKALIKKYIQLSLKEEKHGMVVFSITERDVHHKLWLEVVYDFHGATVVRTNSRCHGGYPCWMICIPEEPDVGFESFVVDAKGLT